METPPRTPPSVTGQDAVAKITKSGRNALWLGAGALLLTLFFFYLGIVAGLAAVIIGFRAQAAGRRVPMHVRGAVPGIVMGTVGFVISLLLLVMSLYMWNDLQAYTNCQRSANTISDQTACKDTLSRAFERKFHMPKGSLHVPF